MKSLWKEYPMTIILISLCTLMIPISIILYFVLGTTRLGEVMLNYGIPIICTGIISFIFEMVCVKHGTDKDDKTKN